MGEGKGVGEEREEGGEGVVLEKEWVGCEMDWGGEKSGKRVMIVGDARRGEVGEESGKDLGE